MKIKLDRPPLLVDLIIEKLQEVIISGELPPGMRLTEEKLSRELNASRTPIRESLIKLEQMGFVRRRANGGWDVVSVDFDKILDRYEVKVMIEVYSLLSSTKAARTRFLKKVDPILSQQKQAVEVRDYEGYRDLDLKFHQTFLLMHENEYLERMYGDTIKHIQWVRKVAIALFLDVKDSFRDHLKIVTEIRNDNVHQAAVEHLAHLDRLIKKVRDEIKKNKTGHNDAI